MKPFRLFAILVLLTSSALAIVYYRVASVRTAHRIQELHGQQWDLLRQERRQKVEIAQRTSLPQISESAQKTGSSGKPKTIPNAPWLSAPSHAEEHD